ncbi:MAG: hypothetical protein KBH81_03195 [Phycisphaerae bacterium]|jgi:hypothetical protein|nr:hypothetical protein [Phycisphaerae bacterium]HOO18349.1 hypothetical protein [Phycisphaerae bacterium]HPC22568.1 hypothetical protein [Phycisphaerae bacterium]HRS28514.1 hypothetical protein [Phycisphaerae bacterium]HRT42337.1 hypothetical protein [Phycisphaerae bacterium]
MVYRLILPLLSAAVLLGGLTSATAADRDWNKNQRATFRGDAAYHRQVQSVRDGQRGYTWRGGSDWGWRDGRYYGGRNFSWGWAGPRYYSGPVRHYSYSTPYYHSYVYRPPVYSYSYSAPYTYYYRPYTYTYSYVPYRYAAYPDTGFVYGYAPYSYPYSYAAYPGVTFRFDWDDDDGYWKWDNGWEWED